MPAELTPSVLAAFQTAKDSQAEAHLRESIFKTAVSTREAAQADEARTLSESKAAHETAIADAEAAVAALKTDLELG